MNINKVIQDTIKEYKKKYNDSPKEINFGNCDQFAWDVIKKMGGESEILSYQDVLFEHCFIKYKNKYYDSECSNGVTHYKLLPHFKRKLEDEYILNHAKR